MPCFQLVSAPQVGASKFLCEFYGFMIITRPRKQFASESGCKTASAVLRARVQSTDFLIQGTRKHSRRYEVNLRLIEFAVFIRHSFLCANKINFLLERELPSSRIALFVKSSVPLGSVGSGSYF